MERQPDLNNHKVVMEEKTDNGQDDSQRRTKSAKTGKKNERQDGVQEGSRILRSGCD